MSFYLTTFSYIRHLTDCILQMCQPTNAVLLHKHFNSSIIVIISSSAQAFLPSPPGIDERLAWARNFTMNSEFEMDILPAKSDEKKIFTNFSSINLVSIFRYFSSSSNPVYVRHVDSSSLGFSLSSYRKSYIRLVFTSRFIDS